MSPIRDIIDSLLPSLRFIRLFLWWLAIHLTGLTIWLLFFISFALQFPLCLLWQPVQRNGQNQRNRYHNYPDELAPQDMVSYSNGEERGENGRCPGSYSGVESESDGIERAKRRWGWTNIV